MQVACEVTRNRVDKPAEVRLDQFLLEFRDTEAERKLTAEEVSRVSKSHWLPVVVGKRTRETVSGKTVTRTLGGKSRKGPTRVKADTPQNSAETVTKEPPGQREDTDLSPRRQLRVGPNGPIPDEGAKEGS